MNRILLIGLAVIAAPVVAAPTAATQKPCAGTDPVASFQSQPPLLAAEAGTALKVEWYADGCVSVIVPRQNVAAGHYVLQLGPTENAAYRSALEQTSLTTMDLAALKARLQQRVKSAPGPVTLIRVTDENSVRFVVSSAAKRSPIQLTYNSLRQDLLRFPGQPELEALLAAETIFLDLARQARAAGTKVMP